MKNLKITLIASCLCAFSTLHLQAQFKPRFIANISTIPTNASIIYELPTRTTSFKPKKNMVVAAKILTATEECSSIQFKYALLLDREVESITNSKFFESVEYWWGTRYRYGGTTKYGIDCSSYTGHVYESAFNFKLPRTAREQYAMCVKVNRFNLREGDLVFFNTRGGVSHVGIYISDGYFTHSSSSSGVTISNLDEAYYSRKYIGGGRVIAPIEEYVEP